MVCHVVWWIGINCFVENTVPSPWLQLAVTSSSSVMSCLCPFGLQFSLLLGCCSCLFYVVVNLICIFLVSRQLVLISVLPKFLHYKKNKKGCIKMFFWKISSALMSVVFLSFFVRVQISHPHTRMGTSNALYKFILENSRTEVDFKMLFQIPSSWANFASFFWL
jgi:hypothetical protein